MHALITVLGGVAEVFDGDATIIDFDDWNDSDTTPERRQEIIKSIQAAGYRCIVHDEPDEVGAPNIQIFKPDEDYSDYITNRIPDSHGFVVYDPAGTSYAPKEK